MPTASHHVPRPQAHPRRARVDRSLLGRVGPAWLTMLAICGPLLAASVEVRLKLPVRARIDLENRDTILPAPFIVVSQEGSGNLRGTDIDVQKEFERYLHKVLRRETDLRVIEPTPVDYPTYDLDMLSREKDFWAVLGERSKADLILVGSLDFDIQDRTGYQTEEFVSPLDGRTYYRQVLVEQTGFEYDILMFVVDAETGRVLYRDNFKDFRSFPSGEVDPVVGMFENLYSLEDRILAVFTQKEVEARRVLFTGAP
jgi:hypothetical protein